MGQLECAALIDDEVIESVFEADHGVEELVSFLQRERQAGRVVLLGNVNAEDDAENVGHVRQSFDEPLQRKRVGLGHDALNEDFLRCCVQILFDLLVNTGMEYGME